MQGETEVEFKIATDVVSQTWGFTTDGYLYCSMMKRRVAEIPVASIVEVQKRTSAMSSGDMAGFQIHYFDTRKNKRRKLSLVQYRIGDPDAAQFLALLEQRLPETTGIVQQSKIHEMADGSGNRIWDIQLRWLRGSTAVLHRSVALWLFTIIFGVMIIPLPLFIYMHATGAYRIILSGEGIRYRKIQERFIPWASVQSVLVELIEYRQNMMRVGTVARM
ncbi:MAG: hypothetical protein KC561_13005, partial [Myxococcales bacterium]|nr:hypothetical protein [Myxococcales bacterium]